MASPSAGGISTASNASSGRCRKFMGPPPGCATPSVNATTPGARMLRGKSPTICETGRYRPTEAVVIRRVSALTPRFLVRKSSSVPSAQLVCDQPDGVADDRLQWSAAEVPAPDQREGDREHQEQLGHIGV